MKKLLIFLTPLLIFALCLCAFAGCSRSDGEQPPEDVGGEQTDGLPEYEQTANVTLKNEFSDSVYKYKIFDGVADSVFDEQNAPVEFECLDGATFVDTKVIDRSGTRTFKVFNGKTLTYAKVVVVQYIGSVADFENINANLNGYYVLRQDLDFGGKGTVIGKVPLKTGTSAAYVYDKTGLGSTFAQVGEPFSGTFDGDGHTISNFKIDYAVSPNYRSAYCLAMFGFVGADGYVGNFELKNSSVTSVGHYGAFVAAVNLGVIDKIKIHTDCSLEVQYDGVGGIALYNGGTISGVDCYVTQATGSAGKKNIPAVFENAGESDGYIGAPYPVNVTLQDGEMNFVEGIQPDLSEVELSVTYSDGSTGVLNVVRCEGYNPNGVVGVKQTVKLFYGKGDDDFVTATITPTAKSVVSIELVSDEYKMLYTVGDESLDLRNMYIDVSYDNGTTERLPVELQMIDSSDYNLDSVGSYTVTIRYGQADCSFVITVREQGTLLQRLEVVGTLNTERYPIGGVVSQDDLSGVTLLAYYSDEPIEVQITPAMIEYDFSQAGETQITITFDGQVVTLTVTVYDYPTELNVRLRGDNKTLTFDAQSQPNFNDVCEFTVTMASGEQKTVTDVTASEYRAGLCEDVVFTYDGMSVTSEIKFEIWYIITQASEWKLMNQNLSGYYRLGGNIILDKTTSAVIGVAPLGKVANDDGYEITVEGTERVGVPFTGKFDGDGHSVFGFTSDFADKQPYDIGSYALTPFGYIGKGAYVGNFVLSGASIKCGQAGSFIAGLNLGEIDRVTIEADCQLFVHYGANVPAVAVVNGGKISNVTCRATQFGNRGEGGIIAKAVQENLQGGTVTDCHLAATEII